MGLYHVTQQAESDEMADDKVTGLLALPNELLLDIVDLLYKPGNLHTQSRRPKLDDLNALVPTNHELYSALNDVLY